MFKPVLLATAAFALVACGQDERTTNTGYQSTQPTTSAAPTAVATPTAVQPVTMRAAEFAQMVVNSDLFEIQSSELAAQRAQRNEVKEFAAMMVRDHTASTQQLTALAPRINLTPPTAQLDPAKRAQIEALRGQTGAAFDTAYINAQVTAHTEAIALFERYATGGEAGPLRDWANETLPKLRAHLSQAQGLATPAAR